MPSLAFFAFSLFFILGTFAPLSKLFFLPLLSAFLLLKPHKKFFIVAILAFIAGYFYFLLRTPAIEPAALQSVKNQKSIIAEIVSESKNYGAYQKFIAKTRNIKSELLPADEAAGRSSRLKISPTPEYKKSGKSLSILVYAPVFYKIQYGDIVELSGDFEVFSDRNQNFQGIFLKGSVKNIKKQGESKTAFGRIFKVKNFIEEKLALQIPSESFEIVSGLLYGKDISSPELKSSFKNAGLSHLTAMSGYNLTVVSSAVFNLLKYFTLSKFIINFVSIIFLTLFVVFTGAQGSVVRAFIMSIILILIKTSGRIPLSRNILLAVMLLITIVNPAVLSYDLGFQLSFLAICGIIYLSPRLEEKMKRKNFLVKTFSETLGAQIMVLPLLWYKFGEFNLFSIFTNLIILPLIPFFMFLGFLILIFIFLPILPLILSYPLGLFSTLIKTLSRLPIVYFNPPAIFIIFIYSYVFYLIYRLSKNALPDFHFNFH